MKRSILAATVVAVLAITGGAFAAGQITGKQIKNSTITGKDVKNKSLTRADFRGSVRGPTGPQGPAGPSATGQLVRVEGPNTTIAPGAIDHTTVNCPGGMNVVSGGYQSATADGEVFSSDSFGSTTSWSALLDNFDSSVTGTVKAIAFCAPAGRAVVARSNRSLVQRRIDTAIAHAKAAHR